MMVPILFTNGASVLVIGSLVHFVIANDQLRGLERQ